MGARKPLKIIIIVLIILITNFITFFAARYLPVLTGNAVVIQSKDSEQYNNIKKILYLENQLQSNSLYNVSDEDLWNGAFKGLVSAVGDDYSEYLTEEEYDAYQQNNIESFYGIGVTFQNDENNNILVVKVNKDGPAYNAGIKIGDIVTKADDTDLRGMSTSEAVNYIRGEKNTSVRIEFERDGEIYSEDIQRAEIKTVIVTHEMLENKIGYVHIYEIHENSYEHFKKAVKDLQSQGMKGLILDVRQNGGGSVDQALKIADDMLGKGEIMYTLDNNGEKEISYSDKFKLDIPVVALIDEYSASASEIIVGALQDNDAAEVVGKKSFGKGIIQLLVPLDDGSMYKHTIMEYFLPSSQKIHKIGLIPDYEVEKGEKHEFSLIEDIPHEEDAQLMKAIERLEQLIK